KQVTLYISSIQISTTHFLLSKYYNPNHARRLLPKFKVLVEVLPLDDKIIELAFASALKDFEDAIQFCTAIENDTDMIITRNKKDFRQKEIPVLTAKEYLSRQ